MVVAVRASLCPSNTGGTGSLGHRQRQVDRGQPVDAGRVLLALVVEQRLRAADADLLRRPQLEVLAPALVASSAGPRSRTSRRPGRPRRATIERRASGVGRHRRSRTDCISSLEPGIAGHDHRAPAVQPQDPGRPGERAQHDHDAAVLAQWAIVSAPLPTKSRYATVRRTEHAQGVDRTLGRDVHVPVGDRAARCPRRTSAAPRSSARAARRCRRRPCPSPSTVTGATRIGSVTATASASLERELNALLGRRRGPAGHDARVPERRHREPQPARQGRRDRAARTTPTQVAETVSWCYEHDVPIIPRGGGTGFTGGAVPLDGGVVLSLERLDKIRHLDPGLVAGRGRGRRDHRRPAPPRARERAVLPARSGLGRAVPARRQHRHQRRRPARLQVRRDRRLGHRARGRARAGRARPDRRRRSARTSPATT